MVTKSQVRETRELHRAAQLEPGDDSLSTRAAAVFLGISGSRLRRLVDSGELVVVNWRVTRSSIVSYMRRNWLK